MNKSLAFNDVIVIARDENANAVFLVLFNNLVFDICEDQKESAVAFFRSNAFAAEKWIANALREQKFVFSDVNYDSDDASKQIEQKMRDVLVPVFAKHGLTITFTNPIFLVPL